jgi:TfoX/Sxy family transcriptional regulator of competence genes
MDRIIGSSAEGMRMSAEFDAVRAVYLGRPDITERRMMGGHGLHVGGKCFVMEYKGAFVAKLPRERVDALVAEGAAVRFDSGSGRQMKEWAAVPAGRSALWAGLADEAFRFVGAGR